MWLVLRIYQKQYKDAQGNTKKSLTKTPYAMLY